MRLVLLALLALLLGPNAYGQKAGQRTREDKAVIDCFGRKVDFAGGPAALLRYLAARTAVVPHTGTGGTVFIQLQLTKQGEVSRARVLKGINHTLDSAAVAITQALPQFWVDSAAVYPDDFWYSVPVRFGP